MSKEKRTLSIGEVVEKTGLSERALRHYEAEGLLAPARTEAGRRVYQAGDMLALARVTLLKKAGFTVAQMRSLMNGKGPDAASLVAAQIDILKAQRAQLDTAVKILSAVQRRLGDGEEIDVETLCELIRTGERTMEHEQWKKVLDRYYTPEEQERWRKVKESAFKGFDQAAYNKAWKDLSDRIEKALPMDPASEKAQAFVKEWNKLLEPFMKVATPEMKAGAKGFWSRIDEWEGEVKSPISSKVAKFMGEAMKARGV
jgi:DNA-binding transcriptional MerR regulator